MGELVGLPDVQAAALRLAGIARRTPLVELPAPPGRPPLLLKAESLQPIGAFKIRGAYHAAARLSGPAGLVTHSSGNHGQAVAWAARALGLPAVVVMPETAEPVKAAAVAALGATVVPVPVAERAARAAAEAAARGFALLPPYDDRDVIAGQGTVGLEIAAQAADVDLVLVPVGGGGLLSGVAAAIRALAPAATVVGVEPELAGDAAESLRAGRLVGWAPERTDRTGADGLRAAQLGELTWSHIRVLADDIVTVTEAQIAAAVRVIAASARLVAEPSGAVAAAAYLAAAAGDGPALPPARRPVAVLSGGNIAAHRLAEILAGSAPDRCAGPL